MSVQVDLPRFVDPQAATSGEFLPDEPLAINVLELQHRKVSLLLGEPGSGKSTVARSLAAGIDSAILIDLREQFDATLEFRVEKVVSQGPSVLVLDSLDEWAGSMVKLVGVLKREVLPAIGSGTRVIATCRSGDVHPSLLDVFRNADKAASTSSSEGVPSTDQFVFHLLPLRRKDAAAFMQARGLEPDALLSKLSSANAEPLASNVGLLNLLCETVSADEEVLDSALTLFESAVARALDLTPKGSQPTGLVETQRFIRIAEAAATVTLLQGAPAIRIGGVPKPGEIVLEDLIGNYGEEKATAEDVHLVLESPLFSQFGATSRAFGHKSIASYLAARFLARQDLVRDQLASLLMTPAEAGTGAAVVAQFRELCAWLIVIDAQKFGWLVAADPYSLARYANVIQSKEVRIQVVDELLRAADDVATRLNWSDNFAGLAHPHVADRLSVALGSTNSAKTVALRVLRDRFVPGLEQNLVDIALDTETWPRNRVDAIRILTQNGHASLLLGEVDRIIAVDTDDEIRGEMIQALWPAMWTIEDVLNRLVPQNDSYFGSYYLAISVLARDTDQADAGVLLDWCNAAIANSAVMARGMARLARRLRDLVLENRTFGEVSSIGAPAYQALWLRIARHDRLPWKLADLSAPARLELLEGLFAERRRTSLQLYYLGGAVDPEHHRILQEVPLEWLESKARGADPEDRHDWALLLRQRLDPFENASLEIAWQFKTSAEWDVFEHWFKAIPLEGPEAESMKRLSEAEAEHAALERRQAEDQLEIASALMARLRTCEENPRRFWEFVLALDFNKIEFGSDLLKSPNLQLVTEDLTDRVLMACERYLKSLADNWLPKFERGVHSRPLHAASRAATTLLRHSPDTLDLLPPESWDALTVPVLTTRHQLANEEVERDLIKQLVVKVDEKRRDSLVAAFDALFALFEQVPEKFWDMGLVDGLLGDEWRKAVTRKLKSVSDENLEALLGLAFHLAPEAATDVCLRIAEQSNDAARIGTALGAMSRDYPSEAGAAFLRVCDRGRHIAKPVALHLAPMGRWQGATLGGSPDQVAALYVQMREMFPPAEDKVVLGAHIVGPDEEARELRESLLRSLVDTSTSDSINAVKTLITDHPTWDLNWAWGRARENFFQSAWTPVTPNQLRDLLDDSSRRMARSVPELRAVIIEGLNELRDWLLGEIPQAFALWNVEAIPGKPKDENTISDWYCHGLRLLFEKRNIIVNREVEVTRATGAGLGSRNDLRVDATSEDGTLSVVIEVKRCMNSDLGRGLKEQLDLRYLKNMGLTHGIYLVVCFPFDQLISNSTLAKHSLESLTNRIAGYATDLVSDVEVVIHEARLPVNVKPSAVG
jgi:energy-coupling factor transporter ATP-binding protein EcfA2